MRTFFVAVLFSILSMQACFAQSDSTTVSGASREKLFEHSIGVQVNQLMQQVFNFNNSSTNAANNNPYLLIYSINLRKSGWGLRVGLGYSATTTASDDGVTSTNSTINNTQLRLGIEKAFKLSKKWSAGAGIDGLYNVNDNNTTEQPERFRLIPVPQITHTTTATYGAGAMGWLRYKISKNILIGSEVSFYYTTGLSRVGQI